ncbi:hypothetical protein D3C72_1695950 [compost metagenome]
MQDVAQVQREVVKIHRRLGKDEDRGGARHAHAVAGLARIRIRNERRVHRAVAQQQRARLGRQLHAALRSHRRVFRRLDDARPLGRHQEHAVGLAKEIADAVGQVQRCFLAAFAHQQPDGCEVGVVHAEVRREQQLFVARLQPGLEPVEALEGGAGVVVQEQRELVGAQVDLDDGVARRRVHGAGGGPRQAGEQEDQRRQQQFFHATTWAALFLLSRR